MKVLVDSDFLVGLFRDEDTHHQNSLNLLEKEIRAGSSLFVSNLVLFETATVLAHRVNMDAVRLFYEKLPKLKLKRIGIDEKMENKSWEIFLKQTKKGCSFVDCANLAAVEIYRFEGILSFDQFYPKNLKRG
ncbi:MAG TPA: PIN domain-containing protein [Patescibacteria group bacterium]|nr:PIN domain-containing protein [Patescibacteria group bacterium]